MKEIQYRDFSLNTHKENWRLMRPNVCQLELTFGCNLHCKHCYTDCYNKPAYLRKEMDTKRVKLIIDKARRSGVIWFCFTGGDPLIRKDFLDIYAYAKNKGFIVTIFTNGYSMTKEIAGYLKRKPPFVIEITLNAASEGLFERISQVKGSFLKVMQGVDLILKAKLPLKIKTKITRDNLKELPKINKFSQSLGIQFRYSYDLRARLNGDLAPCNLRISPQEILRLNGKRKFLDNDCTQFAKSVKQETRYDLFPCAIGGGDGINVDPYGNTFLCNSIRKPSFNLLKVDIEYARSKLLPLVRSKKFATDSRCGRCKLRQFCQWCPGQAYLETGDMESPIDYYCKLTHLLTEKADDL